MWRSEVSTDALSNLNNGVKSDPDREETPAVQEENDVGLTELEEESMIV